MSVIQSKLSLTQTESSKTVQLCTSTVQHSTMLKTHRSVLWACNIAQLSQRDHPAEWKAIFCIKRCRCQKTRSADLFTRYPNSGQLHCECINFPQWCFRQGAERYVYFITHSFGAKPETLENEMWHQETRNIALLYGAKFVIHVLV